MDIPFNYSKLNNEAVELARGELILLLNNDIEVITPEWLEEMAGQAMRASIGAVGVKLLFPDNTIQHAGVTLGVGGVAGHTHRELDVNHPGYFDRLVVVSNYSAVTAACLMVRKELFEDVDGLEEELQVAFNDVDFCLKLLKKGYRNVLLPQVKLYHHESKSRGYEDTPEKMQRFLGEVNLMRERWDELLHRDPCYNPNLTLNRADFSIEIPEVTMQLPEKLKNTK
jgi:O-antigen biosynthesis protein